MMQEYLKSFGVLTEEEITEFKNLAVKRSLKKDDYFIKEGSICKEIAFVIFGFFRSFYHSSSLEEVTYCFTFSNTFISAYSSFISQNSTIENIQALTDVELLVIQKKDILKLENSSNNWLRLFKMIAEQEYINMENRIFMLQRENAEIKYQDLLKNQPEYLQKIPLNFLSSYLGITQRHLSRIRKSISN